MMILRRWRLLVEDWLDDGMMKLSRLMIKETVLYSLEVAGYIVGSVRGAMQICNISIQNESKCLNSMSSRKCIFPKHLAMHI